ncbi:MAG: hypothetical protein Alpg2KO_15960 [Alphaproteobacteria bacterium]
MTDWAKQVAVEDAATAQAEAERHGLSGQAIQALHKRSKARLQKLVDDALPDGASNRLRSSMEKYVSKATRARKPLKASSLKKLAKRGWLAVAFSTMRMKVEDFSRKEKRLLRSAFAARDADLHDDVFKGQDRIYIPLAGATRDEWTDSRFKIEQWLEERGYTQIDYLKGVCVDDRKNTRKIGRLLRKDAPALLEEFNNDDTRAKLDNMIMVISRNPDDVSRMSTNRGWASCMASGGIFWERSLGDVTHGTLIAYAIRDTDPEIQDPLARVLLKPFTKQDDPSTQIYRAASIYGIKIPALRDEAQSFVDAQFNVGKTGRFSLKNGLYNDGDNPHIIVPSCDLDAETFLRELGHADQMSRDENGRLVLNGSLYLNDAQLTRLPDLSEVTIKGHLNLAGNALTNLIGCPQVVTGGLILSGNPLTSFEGMPEKVGERLVLGNRGSYSDAPEETLTSTEFGLPEIGSTLQGELVTNRDFSPAFSEIHATYQRKAAAALKAARAETQEKRQMQARM